MKDKTKDKTKSPGPTVFCRPPWYVKMLKECIDAMFEALERKHKEVK